MLNMNLALNFFRRTGALAGTVSKSIHRTKISDGENFRKSNVFIKHTFCHLLVILFNYHREYSIESTY